MVPLSVLMLKLEKVGIWVIMLAPLVTGPKAQGGDGQVVAFQAQHRQTDEPGKEGCHQTAQNDGHQDPQSQAEHSVTEDPGKQVRQGELHRRASVEVIDRILGGHGDRQDGIGVRAQEHEARLSQGEQSGEAVEQIHGHGDQCIDRALFQHGEQLAGGTDGVFQKDHQGQRGHGPE